MVLFLPVISILFWNVGGIGKAPTRKRSKSFATKYKAHLLVVSEPMIKLGKLGELNTFLELPSYTSSCLYDVKIWILRRQGWRVDLLSIHDQCYNIKVVLNSDLLFLQWSMLNAQWQKGGIYGMHWWYLVLRFTFYV